MADRYWVGGTGTWPLSNAWSTTSGGAPGASAPTSVDNAIFDANSGTGTVSIQDTAICATLNHGASNITLQTSWAPATTVQICTTLNFTAGSFSFQSGGGLGGMGVGANINITGTSAKSITFNGKHFRLNGTTSQLNITAGSALSITGTPSFYFSSASSPAATRVVNVTGYNGGYLNLNYDNNPVGGITLQSGTNAITYNLNNSSFGAVTVVQGGNAPRASGSFSAYGSVSMYSLVSIAAITLRGSGTILLGDSTTAVSVDGGSYSNSGAVTFGALSLVNGGSFTKSGSNLTCVSFSSAAGTTLNLGSGLWTVTGTGAVWAVDAGATVDPGTAIISLSNTTNTARTFAGGGKSYNRLTIGGTTGTSVTTITGDNTFSEIATTKTVASTVSLAAGSTQTVGKWSANGTATGQLTLNSAVPGTRANLALLGGANQVESYLTVQDSAVSPKGYWFAPTALGSVDNGNNTGWKFERPQMGAAMNFFG